VLAGLGVLVTLGLGYWLYSIASQNAQAQAQAPQQPVQGDNESQQGVFVNASPALPGAVATAPTPPWWAQIGGVAPPGTPGTLQYPTPLAPYVAAASQAVSQT